jgi:putative nucleotidyltransferase with HDIG domain
VPAARPEPAAPIAVDTSRDGLVHLVRARLTAYGDAHGGAAAADVRSLVASLLRDPAGDIPRLPESAQQAMTLTREATPSVPRITTAFERDAALAQALLQQANSVTYANLGTCSSVRDALLRLGMAGARAVLLSHAVDALFASRALVHRPVVDAIASHLVRTATIARHLAGAAEVPRDDVYTAALLHDVGKLVVLDRLTRLRDDWRREPRIAWPLLSGLLAEAHEALGALTVLSWGLHEDTVAAIAAHHRQPAPIAADAMGQVLCLAERVDIAMITGAPFDLEALVHDARLTAVDLVRARSLLPEALLHPAEPPSAIAG